MAAGLAAAAVPGLSHAALPQSTPGLIEALVVQVVVGALMGFVVQLFVGAVQGAGTIIDQFSGLNLPPAIDPLNVDQSPILGQLYEWMATVLIFVSGAYLLLAQGFIRSFAVVGTTVPEHDIQQIAHLFELGPRELFRRFRRDRRAPRRRRIRRPDPFGPPRQVCSPGQRLHARLSSAGPPRARWPRSRYRRPTVGRVEPGLRASPNSSVVDDGRG